MIKSKMVPAVMLLLLLAALPLYAADPVPDSTLVGRPAAPNKSLGEKILVVPETILKSPLYALKGLSWLALNGIYRNHTLNTLAGYAFSFKPQGGIVPVVSFGSNAGWRYGLGYVRQGLFQEGDRARWVASTSTNKYRRLEMTYSSPRTFSESLGLQFIASYRKRPRESFYGIGNDTKDTSRAAFTLERTIVGVTIPKKISGNLALEVNGTFTSVSIADGESPDWPGSLPELETRFGLTHADFRSANMIGGGVAIDHDWRDNKGQPSKGGRERIALHYDHGLSNGDDLHEVTTRFELTEYLNLYHKRLLAFRLLAQSVDTDDKEVPVLPFYLKSHLGGRDDLRGFLNNRFVDYDMTMATVEYRWPIWEMIDAFVFAEAGRVYSSLSDDFTLRNWHESYGTGLRVWRANSVIASVQVAFSDEERRIYLELGGEW